MVASSCISKSPRLPPELYRVVIENVHQSDLYALLFVSRIVGYEAERALYRVLVVKHMDFDIRLQLLHRLINSSHIALLVRSLEIHALLISTATFSSDNRYWSTVQTALRALTNLKELTIQGNLHLPFPPFCLLTGCTFRLRSLAVLRINSFDQPALEAQTELEELKVILVAPWTAITQQSFPRLSLLSITAFQPADFPNARHTVTHLEIRAEILAEPNCLPFHKIKSLSVHRSISLSVSLAPFPSLRYLQYACVSSFDFVVDEILDQRITLPHLQKLYFIWRALVEPDALDVSKLFSSLRNLQTIAIQGRHDARCTEWVRGVPRPEIMPSYPDGWKDRSWADA